MSEDDNRAEVIGFGIDWKPISTAPRTGLIIDIMHEDVGNFHMAWNPTGTNPLFAPGVVGIWEAPDQSMTWRDGESGPSHWRHLS